MRFTVLVHSRLCRRRLAAQRLYGINKNAATPSWCLWACAFTALVWLVFHALSDLGPVHPLAKILAVAGQNVLLAYLLSEMLPAAASLVGVDEWYDKAGETRPGGGDGALGRIGRRYCLRRRSA